MCHKFKKWVSDKLDGELSEKKSKKLERHLETCPACRTYFSHLTKIQAGVKSVEEAELSQEYLKDFSIRLKSNLISFPEQERRRMFLSSAFRWGFVTACAVALVSLAVFLFYPGVLSRMETDKFVYSLDDALLELRSDIGDDQELEELFNIMVLASIQNTLQNSDWNGLPGFDERLYEQGDLFEGEPKRVEQENGYDLEI